MCSKMSHGVVGVLKTDLAISKVCQEEFGHNCTTCEDLANFPAIQVMVQKRVNMLEMYGDIMCQVPTIIYAIVAGSLSDKYGRKPLMILPIVGQALEGVALLVNKVWFKELPVEALWLTNIYDILGGGAIWYLAVYGFAADITTPDERASRMARFDGFEQTAFVIGNALSPVLYHSMGYEGVFSVKICLALLSFVIVTKVVKSNTEINGNEVVAGSDDSCCTVAKREEEEPLEGKFKRFSNLVVGMFKTILKKRAGWLRLCILLQISAYGLYYITFPSCRLWYLFLRKLLGWKQDQFIVLKVVRKSVGIVILLLLVPCLKKLKISDTTLLIAFNAMHAIGFLLTSFAGYSLSLFYLGVGLIAFHHSKYALARSLLSQTVTKDEIGRIYSSLAFISAVVPFFSHPLYGLIYHNTVDTFPGAFMVFTSVIIAITAVLMVFNRFLSKMSKLDNESVEDEQIDQLDKLITTEVENVA